MMMNLLGWQRKSSVKIRCSGKIKKKEFRGGMSVTMKREVGVLGSSKEEVKGV